MDKSLNTSEQLERRKLLVRFSLGVVTGLVLAVIYWSYTIYFNYPITLKRGIVGSLSAAIICGLLAAKFDSKLWKAIEELPPFL